MKTDSYLVLILEIEGIKDEQQTRAYHNGGQPILCCCTLFIENQPSIYVFQKYKRILNKFMC